MTQAPPLLDYLMRLADSPLILAQRLGEWIGMAPVIEEDLALTNVGLDLLGQARLWFAYAAEVEAGAGAPGRNEDAYAFLRDTRAYRNLLLVEQPNGNFADTIARQYLFDTWHALALRALARSTDARIAEIAAKAAKEVAYHRERSGDWVIRLGDGTPLSHDRMQAAFDRLWAYTGEMFAMDAIDRTLHEAGVAADLAALDAPWRAEVGAVLAEATLAVPASSHMQGAGAKGGRQGFHGEALGALLAEMQFLQRAYPGARW